MNEQNRSLRDEDGDQKHASVDHAVAVATAVHHALNKRDDNKRPSFWRFLSGLLSNGLVLLLVGSAITAVFVPMFERSLNQRSKQLAMMTETHRTFLQYANSVWREYYSIFPYLHSETLDKLTYIAAVDKIAAIKLERYGEYAKVISLAVAFRPLTESGPTRRSPVEDKVEAYAIAVNNISAKINAILGGLYCKGHNCWSSSYSEPTPFQHLQAFDKVTAEMQEVVQLGEDVAELMVQRIQQEW